MVIDGGKADFGDRKSTRLNSSHSSISYSLFFFNDTATTEIYPLSLHDALPIFTAGKGPAPSGRQYRASRWSSTVGKLTLETPALQTGVTNKSKKINTGAA